MVRVIFQPSPAFLWISLWNTVLARVSAGEGGLPHTLPKNPISAVWRKRAILAFGGNGVLGMTKTSTERQREYRQRARLQGDGARRINIWLSTSADLALNRLADHGGGSRRAVLERLILEADERLTRDEAAK